jgi:MoaA/NifB/PqqE/SkfB family radical SAM enzyme
VHKYLDDLVSCDSVCISLDGPKEENDRIRGGGTHDAVLRAIPLLKQKGVKIRIHSILTKYNLKTGLPYIAEVAKKYDIPFNFSMIVLPHNKKPEFTNISEDEITGFLKEYKGYRDIGYPVFTSDACIKYLMNWPKKGSFTIYKDDKFSNKERRWIVPCNYGQYNAFVDVDGNVYKCATVWKNGLNWRRHGMKACLDHVSKNLFNCVSCRSIGDIDRALLLNFSDIGNIRMVFEYITKNIRFPLLRE